MERRPTSRPTTQNEHVEVKTLEGSVLSLADDFKYLGSYIVSTEKDIEIRKALAW